MSSSVAELALPCRAQKATRPTPGMPSRRCPSSRSTALPRGGLGPRPSRPGLCFFVATFLASRTACLLVAESFVSRSCFFYASFPKPEACANTCHSSGLVDQARSLARSWALAAPTKESRGQKRPEQELPSSAAGDGRDAELSTI